MAVTQLSQDAFEKEVLQSEVPVFVDFYADWCGPCKMTEPIIHEMAEAAEYKEKLTFVKVDVDANQELAMRYNIFSIPTFMIFKKGTAVAQFAGARDRSGFVSEIEQALQK